VLVLRDYHDLGSTFLQALGRYQEKLRAPTATCCSRASKPRPVAQLRDTGMLERIGADNVSRATTTLGEAMQLVTARARRLPDRAG
jgi:hypothetical protein